MGREKVMNSKCVIRQKSLPTQSFQKSPGNISLSKRRSLFVIVLVIAGITALIFRNITAAEILIFAGIPRNFDMSDIDGMRKYYVSSLERMGSLLDIIEKSPPFFGD